MTLTKEEFVAAYPALHKEILSEGHKEGHAEGFQAGRVEGLSAGAKAERERIQSVLGKVIPGHEALVNGLAFDGKTTGPEAAEKVLEAETVLRRTKAESFAAETVKPAASVVVTTEAEQAEAQEANLPVEERCKKQWDRDPKIREEYRMGGLKAFIAFEKNKQNVRVFTKNPE